MHKLLRKWICTLLIMVIALSPFAGGNASAASPVKPSPLTEQLEGLQLLSPQLHKRSVKETSRFDLGAMQKKASLTAKQLKQKRPQPNVSGELKKGGRKVIQANIFFYKLDSESEEVYRTMVNEGKFQVYLPDGEYATDGYYDELAGHFVSYPYSFTVRNGKSVPAPLQMSVPADNTRGVIQKAGSRTKDGYVLFLKKDDDSYQIYEAPVKKGMFSLYLPDGEYELDSFDEDRSDNVIRYSYSFKVKKGKAPLINIRVPADNTKGTLYKADVKVKSATLEVYSMDDELAMPYTALVTDGAFSLYLPDGQYMISGYVDDATGYYVPLTKPLTVKKGKTPYLDLRVPADNLKGAVTQGTYKVMNGEFAVENLEDGNVYVTRITNGEFSIYLPDGQYETLGYYDESTRKVIYYAQAFAVANGVPSPVYLNVQVPIEPITGTLYKGDRQILNGIVVVRNEKTGRYYEGAVENGALNLYLADGRYVVEFYADLDTLQSGPLSYAFTVQNGKSTPSPLEIRIPADNVKGTVEKSGTKPEYAMLVIQDKEGMEYPVDVLNGEFSTYLPDGAYNVIRYWDFSMEEDMNVNYSFSVANGVTNPASLHIQLP